VGGGLALVAGACQRADQELTVPDKPQLEALPAGYRALNRTDTLLSVPADLTPTDTSTRRIIVTTCFVPASTMRRGKLRTLAFRHTSHYLYPLSQASYHWYFSYQLDQGQHFDDDADHITRQVFGPITDRLILSEYEPGGTDQYRAARYTYLMDYPFVPAGVALVNDSVVYVRAYPVRQNVRQADTYAVTHYERRGPDRLQIVPTDSIRIPRYADFVDSAWFVNIRFTLRRLSVPRT
jgi:hypothetical protein